MNPVWFVLAGFVAAVPHHRPAPLSPSLVGTWRLAAFEVRDSAGVVTYPMGRHTDGQLILDTSGHASLHIMNPERPRFAVEDRARGTDAEVRAAFVGYLAYYGRYTVDEAKTTLTIRVEGASFPNWIGSDQIRRYAFVRDSLIITTPPMTANGSRLTTRLAWVRL
ncbi:MAG: lipocalin-like domain-containing protein [Gemmatimonadota bacterium]